MSNLENHKRYTETLTKELYSKFVKHYNEYTIDPRDAIFLNYSGTRVKLNNLQSVDSIGMRVLATLYDSFRDLELNCPDVRIMEIIFDDVYSDGSVMRDYLVDEETELQGATAVTISELFKLLDHIRDNITLAKPLTFAEIVKLRDVNEEIKALCLSSNKIDVTDHLTKVDTYVSNIENPKGEKIVYDLFKGKVDLGTRNEPMEVDLTYVRTYDASTDRMFQLQVYNSIERAIDAPACLVDIPTNLVDHLTGITRQGEKYVFTYDISDDDPTFEEKLNSKPTYLKGEKFFELLTYEC